MVCKETSFSILVCFISDILMLFLLGTAQQVLTIIRLHLMSHNEDAKKQLEI
jgi:hypothetical protein